MPATVRLDGFPDLSFKGRIEHDRHPWPSPACPQTVRSVHRRCLRSGFAPATPAGPHRLRRGRAGSGLLVRLQPARVATMRTKGLAAVVAVVALLARAAPPGCAIAVQRRTRSCPRRRSRAAPLPTSSRFGARSDPVRSTLVLAPGNAGELTIITIAKNGAAVKAGEIVARIRRYDDAADDSGEAIGLAQRAARNSIRRVAQSKIAPGRKERAPCDGRSSKS